jgi:hypothetical protein|tara:strand:- start:2075 stop:2560 length:486 start_codon:yes stop_codon:yes gene_type:complete
LELNDYDKSRCRFHLGYNTGANLPAGDIARLEEAMARIPDSYFYNRTTEHLDRCDKAYKLSQVFKSETQPQPSRIQRITGDTDRAIYQSDPIKADKDYREIYLREVDRLAETLYVANYRRDEVRRYAFDRSGSEFIMAIKGPADTAVGTRVSQAVGSMNWR